MTTKHRFSTQLHFNLIHFGTEYTGCWSLTFNDLTSTFETTAKVIHVLTHTYVCTMLITLPKSPTMPRYSTQSCVFTTSSCVTDTTANSTAPPRHSRSPSSWFFPAKTAHVCIPPYSRVWSSVTVINMTATTKVRMSTHLCPKTCEIQE